MDQLIVILKKSPNTTSINLEFCEIEDLFPYLPILSKFQNLEELVLFGNRLETLPKDLSSLKILKKLDISNNMIESITSIISSLKSLNGLTELNITLNTQEEEEILLSSLPNLIRLNDTEIATNNTFDYSGPEALTQEDLEKVAIMYDEIRIFAKEIDPALDKKLAADFDENVKVIMGELSDAIKNETNSYLTHTHMIIAKFNMFRICQDKASFLVARVNKKLGNFVKELGEAHKLIFSQMGKIIFESQAKFVDKINSLNNEVLRLAGQNSELEKTIEKLEIQLDEQKNEKKLALQSFQEEKLEILKELEMLHEENKKYLDTIIKHSKSNAGSVLNTSTYEEKPKLLSQTLLARTLTLRQLKDAIAEIYESKSKFDEKCLESKMPRETMEQHMYAFLNQKYGLRSLIIE